MSSYRLEMRLTLSVRHVSDTANIENAVHRAIGYLTCGLSQMARGSHHYLIAKGRVN